MTKYDKRTLDCYLPREKRPEACSIFAKIVHCVTFFSHSLFLNLKRSVSYIYSWKRVEKERKPRVSQLNAIIKRVITEICVNDFSSSWTTILFVLGALRRD